MQTGATKIEATEGSIKPPGTSQLRGEREIVTQRLRTVEETERPIASVYDGIQHGFVQQVETHPFGNDDVDLFRQFDVFDAGVNDGNDVLESVGLSHIA